MGGTLDVAVANGAATFGDLSLATVGTYALSAADGTLTSATSNNFTVNTPPTQLVFTTEPVGPTSRPGNKFPSTIVTIEDGSGDIETFDNARITLSDGSHTVTARAHNGVATFGHLVITKAGTYDLTATDKTDDLTGTSTNVVVTAGAHSSWPSPTSRPTPPPARSSARRLKSPSKIVTAI